MRIDLRDDPAVIAIADATKTSEYEVVGRLHHLWSWADSHTADGSVPSVTPTWVDRYLQCPGFAAAMVKAGWLDDVAGVGIIFPNFGRHNGEPAKKRCQESDRKREQREREAREEEAARHGHVTDPSRSCHAGSVTESGTESGLQRDGSVTRREEKKERTTITPSPQFEAFWTAWPGNRSSTSPRYDRKGAKGQCAVAWAKGGLDLQSQVILAHLTSLKGSDSWRKDGGHFIPAPLVYLNQQRWDGAEAQAGSNDISAGRKSV